MSHSKVFRIAELMSTYLLRNLRDSPLGCQRCLLPIRSNVITSNANRYAVQCSMLSLNAAVMHKSESSGPDLVEYGLLISAQ